MGKRSNFEKIDKDFYQTPLNALEPLLPFLAPDITYCEPFVGAGAFVEALHHYRPDITLKSAYDIDPQVHYGVQKDFLDLNASDIKGDMILTNPPWTRKLLHPFIQHCMDMGIETWFLFDMNWIATTQSRDLMRQYCTDVVPVGRLKWIPDSPHSGKDDCAFYRFHPDGGPTILHPARPKKKKLTSVA